MRRQRGKKRIAALFLGRGWQEMGSNDCPITKLLHCRGGLQGRICSASRCLCSICTHSQKWTPLPFTGSSSIADNRDAALATIPPLASLFHRPFSIPHNTQSNPHDALLTTIGPDPPLGPTFFFAPARSSLSISIDLHPRSNAASPSPNHHDPVNPSIF